jgi:hypothetical protein
MAKTRAQRVAGTHNYIRHSGARSEAERAREYGFRAWAKRRIPE